MFFSRFSKVILCSSLLFCSVRAADAGVKSFRLESHYAVPNGGVAEIVAATPDGLSLFYTDAEGKRIGVLDIADPSNPQERGFLATGEAEPTSAAVCADGQYLVVVMRNGDSAKEAVPGTLSIYDIREKDRPLLLGSVSVGSGPDAVALGKKPDGKLFAVVAIEDEESDEAGDATLGGRRPGRVDVVTLDTLTPARSSVVSVEFPRAMLEKIPGVNFTADPQPEFVAIHPNQAEFAVSLQENNAVAVVDISDLQNPRVKRVFCAGFAERQADLKKDGQVLFSDEFRGRREPDAVAYVTVGGEVYLALANEGDTDVETFGDGVDSGGRGVSLHRPDGTLVWDSGVELDRQASLRGHYPDARSNKRGTEVEGVATARFYGDDLLIAVSERGSFLAVYRLTDPFRPELLEILPTGSAPEGVIALEERSDGKRLIVSANEGDGTVNIYSVWDREIARDPADPAIRSVHAPWSALSGFTADGTAIYAVPDNAWGTATIWKLDMKHASQGLVEITEERAIVRDGEATRYDLEGICWTPEGFWLAAEGKSASENRLIFAKHDGTVLKEYALPTALLDRYGDPKNYGFEGVAVARDNRSVYVAMQRGFDAAAERAAILRFDVAGETWDVAWYPLERHSQDAQTFWMGISEIALAGDNVLLVVERDKGTGASAEVKRVYSVDPGAFVKEGLLKKRLVCDIRAEKNLLLEKVESLCVLDGDMWIATDNDGAGWTRMLNLGPWRR